MQAKIITIKDAEHAEGLLNELSICVYVLACDVAMASVGIE